MKNLTDNKTYHQSIELLHWWKTNFKSKLITSKDVRFAWAAFKNAKFEQEMLALSGDF